MKYFLFLIISAFTLLSNSVHSQFCSATGLANMGTITPTGTFQNVSGASGAKRYWTFTATAGCTYDFSTCNSAFTNDTYLRLYSSATGGTILSSNDDNGVFCAGTKASLSWLCTTNGTYSILVTNYSCANLSATTILSFRVTCAPPPPVFNPCSSITNIAACGTTTNFTVSSGNGSYNPPATSCGFTTPGQERIYTFTPTVTTTYTINQNSSFGWIDWFFKPVSSGCNGTGWTCIDDLSGAMTSVSFTLTAGVQYYIMADPETTAGGNVSFSISCPPTYNPCTSISNIPACGSNVLHNFSSGNGAYNPPATSCGFTTPGQEKIYTFTPTVTGTYAINQLSSFGWIDWFFKPVSGGCNGTGWTCIDDLSGAVSSVSFTMTAGVQYYIMADPETTTGGTIQFNLSCPTPPPANDNCINATSITLPYNSGVVSNLGSTDDGPVSFCGQMGSNLWYKVIGDGQEYIATTCDPSTNFDTEIAIYRGSCGSMIEEACNDDDALCSSSGLRSTATWCTLPGVEYFISVGYYTTGGGFGNFRLLVNTGNGCTPLPIELISFDGHLYNGDVILEWQTATEHNNDYFYIERSIDGEVWTRIKEVDAAGNSTTVLNYLTIDEDAKEGINYYRLTQVDFDGQYETFSPIAVSIEVNTDCNYQFYSISGQIINIETVPPGVYFKKCGDIMTKFVKY